MIAAMTYLLAISALLGLAAAAAEGALRARGRPARWVWAAAMAASVGLPLLVRALASVRPSPSLTEAAPALGPVLAPLLVIGEPASTAWAPSPHLLPLLWALLSTLLVGRLLLSWLGLRQDARRWARQRVDGESVLVSPATGPATIGVVHPEIVVPRWALGLDRAARRLMLTHEREHLSAGDPRLLFAGTLLTLAMPWNLPLWWHLRRLRLAVELDCDARVLRGGGDAATYGTLLLEVGRRRAGVPVLSAALAEGRTFLERRIHALAVRATSSARRVAGLGMAAAGLLALAVCTPSPFDATARDADPAPTEVPGEGPRFTPYTEPPRLANPGEVTEALTRLYPPLLRDAGVGGMIPVWAFVDSTGAVTRTRADGAGGDEALQQAALRAMESARFHPATNRGRAVSVWIKLPVRFAVDGGGIGAQRSATDSTTWMKAVQIRLKEQADPDAPRVRLEDAPTFTPYESAPELKNRGEVRAALARLYPPALRDAGVGGTVHVWFFIDAEGRVRETRIDKSSGEQAIDQAALSVAEIMEFTPAENRGAVVPVWLSLPITFRSRR